VGFNSVLFWRKNVGVLTFSWKLPDIKYDPIGEELVATLWGRTFPVQLRAAEVMSC